MDLVAQWVHKTVELHRGGFIVENTELSPLIKGVHYTGIKVCDCPHM